MANALRLLLQPVESLRVPIAESLRQRVAGRTCISSAGAGNETATAVQLPGFVRQPLECWLCSGASRSRPLQPRQGHGLAPAQ